MKTQDEKTKIGKVLRISFFLALSTTRVLQKASQTFIKFNGPFCSGLIIPIQFLPTFARPNLQRRIDQLRGGRGKAMPGFLVLSDYVIIN